MEDNYFSSLFLEKDPDVQHGLRDSSFQFV